MKSFDRYKPAATGLLFLVAAVLFYCLIRGSGSGQLVIEDPRSGIVYYSLSAHPGDPLTLAYRHSVSGSMVFGNFTFTDGGAIQPLSTVFSAFGPGLPWLDGQEEYFVDNGMITVYHQEPPRDKLRLWVSPLTGETILLNGAQYDLSALAEGPLLLEISFRAP
jgi:hypothetical protein